MLNPHRLQSLKDRHTALDARIMQEDARPQPNSLELARLKREKLRLTPAVYETPAAPTGGKSVDEILSGLGDGPKAIKNSD